MAFCDGSALVNPGGPGGTGWVVLDRARPALRFGGTRWVVDGASAVTNNRIERRAVLEALDGLPAGEPLEVISESRYAVDALSGWIHGWRRRGWRTAAGEPVQNRDLIEAIDASAQRVVGTMPVEGNTQPYGLLNGGASLALAETLGSIGAHLHAGAGG